MKVAQLAFRALDVWSRTALGRQIARQGRTIRASALDAKGLYSAELCTP